jgi:hypothetical protein
MSSWDYRNGTAEDINMTVNEIGAQIIAVGNSKKMESRLFETENKAAIGRAWENFENNRIIVETDAHGNEMILPSPDGRNYAEERRLIDAELRKVIKKEVDIDTGRLTPVNRDEPLSEKGMNTHEKEATWDYQVDGGNRFLRVNPSTDPKAWTIQTGTKDRNGQIVWGEKQKLENNRTVQALLELPGKYDDINKKFAALPLSSEEQKKEEERRALQEEIRQFDEKKEREKRSRGPLR